MTNFLDSLIARSFSPGPPTIRPRPLARFEFAESVSPVEESAPDEARAEAAEQPSDGARRRSDTTRANPIDLPSSAREEEPRADVSLEGSPTATRFPSSAFSRPPGSPGALTAAQTPPLLEDIPGGWQPVDASEEKKPAMPPRPSEQTPERRVHRITTERLIETTVARGRDRGLEAAPAAGREHVPDVQVEISIGRIELGAPRPEPRAPRMRPPALRPAVTLDEYLRRRCGGGQ